MYHQRTLTTRTSNGRKGIGRAGLAALVVAAGVAVVLSGVFDSGDSSARSYPLTRLEQKAEELEDRLAEQGSAPLARLTMRAWLVAGGDRISRMETEDEPVATAASEDFAVGLRNWYRYLRLQGGKADPNLAEQAGNTYFVLLELGSRDLDEIEANAAGAARALRIAGRERPILFTLSNEAIYEYFNGEFAAGERAARAAVADAPQQSVAAVREQFVGYREHAETFRDQLRAAKTELRQTGADLLAKPLKAYKDSLGLNQEEPKS